MFLVGMHLTMPNVGGTGLILPFNAWTWLFFALPLGAGFYGLAARGQLVLTPVVTILAVAITAMTVPVFYPQADVSAALPRLAGLWAGWIWLVMLLQPGVINRHHPWLLLPAVAVIIQATIGFAQYFFLEPGNLLGYWAENWRPVGVFNQPNVAATFYATGLAISGFCVVQYDGLLQEAAPDRSGFSRLQWLVVGLLPVVTVPLLLVLGSRTGWIGAIGVLAGISLYALQSGNRRKVLQWLGLVLAGLILGSTMLAFKPEAGSRAVAKANLESPRWVMYRQAWDLIQAAPIAGHGLGRFEPAQVETAARLRDDNPDYPPVVPNTTHPHNEILYVWAEGGLLAVAGFAVCGLAGLCVLVRLPRGRRVPSVILILPILLHTQLELPLYISSIHWLALILFLAIILRALRERSLVVPLRSPVASGVRLASLLVPVVLVFFMGTTLHSNQVLNRFQQQVYRELTDLNAVSNHFVWQSRADWLRFNSALVIGVNNDNPEYVQAFAVWAEEQVRQQPRPVILKHLLAAWNWLGEEQKEAKTREKAVRWFPDQDFGEEITPEIDTTISSAIPGIDQ